MAYEEGLRSITLVADSTLAAYTGVPGQPGSPSPHGANQYCFVRVTGAKQVGLADESTPTVGVLQNKPQTNGSAATVAIRGVSKCVAGGAVNAGDSVKVNAADGKAVTGTLGTDAIVGIALTSGSADEIISVLLSVN